MFRYYNPNPDYLFTGDCVIRAISKLMDYSWDRTYLLICLQGYLLSRMPSTNSVWSQYLYGVGYRRYTIGKRGYTVKDFCRDHPYGKYLLALNGHVIAVVNGDYYDSADTGEGLPIFYWRKEQ